MLDATDPGTIQALRRLVHEVRTSNRPLALWVGAGASAWGEYPLWGKLAEDVHRNFSRFGQSYDKRRGSQLLRSADYPALFQLCRDCESTHFYRFLSDAFLSREPSPVYRRFAAVISEIRPSAILTTNVEDLLETSVPNYPPIGRRDLERAVRHLERGSGFVCKLHGSASDIRSTVFTSEDYNQLVGDGAYVVNLGRILSRVSVIFVGYSLQDRHILGLLEENHGLASLLGDGPHFAILPDPPALSVPGSVHVIRYEPRPHRDHRSSIQVLDEIRQYRAASSQAAQVMHHATVVPKRSAHIIPSLYVPGKNITSQTVELDTGQQFVFGLGWVDSELSAVRSTAMHDLVSGLLCFDEVIAPLHALNRIHGLLGSVLLWQLVRDGILTFVHWSQRDVVIFPGPEFPASGCLESITAFNSDQSAITPGQIIRENLKPNPGYEAEAEENFKILEDRLVKVDEDQMSVPQMARGLLLRPSIRSLLGISESMPLDSIPRWAMFQLLRLVYVVRVGETCRALGISSARLDFGTDLVGYSVFASTAGSEWTDELASYVVGAQLCDLGAVVEKSPSVLPAVVAFRDTQEGARLRADVLKNLAVPGGGDVEATINAGLQQSIPFADLHASRGRFEGLLIAQGNVAQKPPALWRSDRSSGNSVRRWRRRARSVLEEYIRKAGVKKQDDCPCGSHEPLKYCCLDALTE